MKVINRGKGTLVFRDDAGKHVLRPRQGHDVVGDQHLALILSLPGVMLDGKEPEPPEEPEEDEG